MFKVSDAHLNDIASIQEVAYTSWAQTYKNIIPNHVQEAFLNKAYSTEALTHRINTTCFQVVFKDDSLVGFINSTYPNNEGNAHIHAIYLLKAYQGYGLGKQLIQKVIENDQSIKSLTLEVEHDNLQAFQFYNHLGFKIIESYEEDFLGHTLITDKMKLTII